MTTRRDFVQSCVGALGWSGVLLASPEQERVLRVAFVASSQDAEAPAMVRFGALEADRSARLFGWRVSHTLVSRGDSPPEKEVDAWIMAVHGERPAGTAPVLRLVCDARQASDGTFLLAACDPPRQLWDAGMARFGAQQLNDRYRSATGTSMTSAGWLAWFAFKVLLECALRARSPAPADLMRVLADTSTHFDGHMGASLRFDASRRLSYPQLRGPR